MSSSTVKTEIIPYRGWSRALRITNGTVDLVVTLDVGPRILRYGFVGGANVLGELVGDMGKSGEPHWCLRGGHRLWTSPEDPKRTYVLDNDPVSFELRPHGAQVGNSPDPTYKIGKSIDITLSNDGTSVKLSHRLWNAGSEPHQVALWALTVVGPRSIEIVPLETSGRHPPSLDTATAADFAPGSTWAFWPYFRFTDPRVRFSERYLTLRHDPALPATKLGLFHRAGWVAAASPGGLFLKRFAAVEGAAHPDGGCNYETFTNEDILELETLTPLVSLAPGADLRHDELWSLHHVGGLNHSENGIPAWVDETDRDAKLDTWLKPVLP